MPTACARREPFPAVAPERGRPAAHAPFGPQAGRAVICDGCFWERRGFHLGPAVHPPEANNGAGGGFPPVIEKRTRALMSIKALQSEE